jgi:hypothetical protein
MRGIVGVRLRVPGDMQLRCRSLDAVDWECRIADMIKLRFGRIYMYFLYYMYVILAFAA